MTTLINNASLSKRLRTTPSLHSFVPLTPVSPSSSSRLILLPSVLHALVFSHLSMVDNSALRSCNHRCHAVAYMPQSACRHLSIRFVIPEAKGEDDISKKEKKHVLQRCDIRPVRLTVDYKMETILPRETTTLMTHRQHYKGAQSVFANILHDIQSIRRFSHLHTLEMNVTKLLSMQLVHSSTLRKIWKGLSRLPALTCLVFLGSVATPSMFLHPSSSSSSSSCSSSETTTSNQVFFVFKYLETLEVSVYHSGINMRRVFPQLKNLTIHKSIGWAKDTTWANITDNDLTFLRLGDNTKRETDYNRMWSRFSDSGTKGIPDRIEFPPRHFTSGFPNHLSELIVDRPEIFAHVVDNLHSLTRLVRFTILCVSKIDLQPLEVLCNLRYLHIRHFTRSVHLPVLPHLEEYKCDVEYPEPYSVTRALLRQSLSSSNDSFHSLVFPNLCRFTYLTGGVSAFDDLPAHSNLVSIYSGIGWTRRSVALFIHHHDTTTTTATTNDNNDKDIKIYNDGISAATKRFHFPALVRLECPYFTLCLTGATAETLDVLGTDDSAWITVESAVQWNAGLLSIRTAPTVLI